MAVTKVQLIAWVAVLTVVTGPASSGAGTSRSDTRQPVHPDSSVPRRLQTRHLQESLTPAGQQQDLHLTPLDTRDGTALSTSTVSDPYAVHPAQTSQTQPAGSSTGKLSFGPWTVTLTSPTSSSQATDTQQLSETHSEPSQLPDSHLHHASTAVSQLGSNTRHLRQASALQPQNSNVHDIRAQESSSLPGVRLLTQTSADMGEPDDPKLPGACHIPNAQDVRIFLVGHMATLTGAPIGLQQLAEQLRDCGAQVDMLFIIGGEFEHIVRLSNIPYQLGMVAIPPSERDVFIVNTVAEASAMWVRAQVEQFGAAFLRKLVWWVQELHNIETPDTPTLELLGKAAEVVFVANAAHEYWMQIHHSYFSTQFGFPRFRTIYLALGHEWLQRNCDAQRVGSEERSAARAEMNITQEDYVALHMGQIIPHKGVIELIHAAKHVMASDARLRSQQAVMGRVQILLVGPHFDELFLNRAQSLIQELGLEDSVKLVKPVTNPHTYYKLADVFIMNSECENFARVVLEAMAISLPVLGTRCGGTVEQVTEYVSGLLHSFGNARELAKNIMHVDVRTPDGAAANAAMGRAGCVRAQTEFDINLKFAEWDRVVHSVKLSGAL